MYCIQLCCVLLYYKVPPIETFDGLSKESPLFSLKPLLTKNASIPYSSLNVFEETVKQITEFTDIELLYKGIKGIFEKSLDKNYERDFLKEAMALLTKITKVNPKFLDDLYLYDHDFNFLMISTCHYITHFATKPGGEGLAYLNLSLLQQYSERREFAINMNKECKVPGGVELAYTESTYADCFIVFVRDMVLTPNVKLDQLGLSLLGILANMYHAFFFKRERFTKI